MTAATRPRYEAQPLHNFPIGSGTAHGVWDFQNGAFIRVDGRTWSTWEAPRAIAQASSLNAGKGLL